MKSRLLPNIQKMLLEQLAACLLPDEKTED
jgi:hypothetical protein